MDICSEKTKLMTNNTNGIGIRVCDKKLNTIESFNYRGAIVKEAGCNHEIALT
ncbi:hypothetical protein DPMN_027104 [Dreissena polymorpha]|uniref:Uncharacterized protein n=1 Tax=Dreissena polymorpha TaxID=45954 RepID=A0A9D4RF72_DREPO|nr:hypothetical protein DPMN_027104 [Dreissena polymorpha]